MKDIEFISKLTDIHRQEKELAKKKKELLEKIEIECSPLKNYNGYIESYGIRVVYPSAMLDPDNTTILTPKGLYCFTDGECELIYPFDDIKDVTFEVFDLYENVYPSGIIEEVSIHNEIYLTNGLMYKPIYRGGIEEWKWWLNPTGGIEPLKKLREGETWESLGFTYDLEEKSEVLALNENGRWNQQRKILMGWHEWWHKLLDIEDSLDVFSTPESRINLEANAYDIVKSQHETCEFSVGLARWKMNKLVNKDDPLYLYETLTTTPSGRVASLYTRDWLLLGNNVYLDGKRVGFSKVPFTTGWGDDEYHTTKDGYILSRNGDIVGLIGDEPEDYHIIGKWTLTLEYGYTYDIEG